MDRLVARGKFLFEGERKFHARGVSYGPFAPNSRGERYPEPERAGAGFRADARARRQRGAHLRAAAAVDVRAGREARTAADGRDAVAVSHGVSRLAPDVRRHPRHHPQLGQRDAPLRRRDLRLQPRQRNSLRHRALARRARGQPLHGRALRPWQKHRARLALHLLELSVVRISRSELPRFHLLQRLSASRDPTSAAT